MFGRRRGDEPRALSERERYNSVMAAKRKNSASRYDVPGNVEAQYVDANQTVLVNKRGVTDGHALAVAEEACLTRAYEILISEVRTDTPMTCELLRHIHATIFGELFDWAGRWRTVRISKPGVIWPPPDYLDEGMAEFEQDVLRRYNADSLGTDDEFCQAIGHIQGEFLAIHPFREGNARTIKLLTNLLALQTGRPPLAYDKTDAGSNRYIDAARAAIAKDYRPMTAMTREALNAARRSPATE